MTQTVYSMFLRNAISSNTTKLIKEKKKLTHPKLCILALMLQASMQEFRYYCIEKILKQNKLWTSSITSYMHIQIVSQRHIHLLQIYIIQYMSDKSYMLSFSIFNKTKLINMYNNTSLIKCNLVQVCYHLKKNIHNLMLQYRNLKT